MNGRGRLTVSVLVLVLVLSLALSGTAVASGVHEVVRGDTLWLISQRYGSNVNSIMQENNLRSTMIYPGMRLVIPGISTEEADRGSIGAQALPWSTVNGMWARYSVVEVEDVRTGLTFNVKRRGGWAHADVEPLTWNDTQTMRQAYGGSWSWSRRPIVVTIRGVRVAASMNGMPHGRQMIWNNGFNGHHCIHFLNSTTHGSQIVCRNHQAAMREAVGH